MVKPRLVQCVQCHGRNWVKVVEVDAETGLWLWQCGGGPAHSEAEDIKNGCGRLIVATEAEIMAEGQI
jgi:hypothetical protein